MSEAVTDRHVVAVLRPIVRGTRPAPPAPSLPGSTSGAVGGASLVTADSSPPGSAPESRDEQDQRGDR